MLGRREGLEVEGRHEERIIVKFTKEEQKSRKVWGEREERQQTFPTWGDGFIWGGAGRGGCQLIEVDIHGNVWGT